MIVDIHTHFWDFHRHGSETFREECKCATRGKTNFETEPGEFMRAQQPCDRVVVFGGKALHVGLNVPNDYVADFCKRDPRKLIPFMALDPSETDMMGEFERCLHQFKMRGIKLLPMLIIQSWIDDYPAPSDINQTWWALRSRDGRYLILERTRKQLKRRA